MTSQTTPIARRPRPVISSAALWTASGSGTILLLDALATLLTLMLVAVAAMGVLNMVVLDTCERVRDLGIHKALGMTPWQTIAMPRSNLRRAQTIVESFCRRHGLTYCQTGLFESYAQALRHLHAVGRTPCSAGA
ncbi:FtsX-like permease family protein [Micromonospora sp. NPDC007230]|uniref:FtsX-like permease family protein n=1 Tax=Micromonospora sp. NPDC007230 TaxID=3364237 RepID=UPI003699B042